MRELFLTELNLISGGVGPEDFDNYKPPRGTATVVKALDALKNRSALGGAFSAGYWVGEQINKHTPVQEWIADGIDKLTSKDGNDYCEDGGDY
ncbi:MAG: hypothetical protein Q4F77_11075 [Acinetobacter sp.]|uniref:hypothetical protein n=1 Tax=Acinetobacter sp. TaxID=472 RepID=UPI0026E030F8|nr:hypothetical protein [Acinetobacter sp.]MDO5543835.1 hypothetical protein [Acinetobacter sp.]